MPRRTVSAAFVVSAASPRDFPTDGLPEIAFVGRSNVGKSTLINALVRQDIARTSATPGKTRLINVYRVVPAAATPFYLMDLPGYGHAGGGEEARREFAALTALYFGLGGRAAGRAPREALAGAVLAIDARHPGVPSDVDAMAWLSAHGVPALLVATKADKLSQSARATLGPACERAFGQQPLAVSALSGDGLDALWHRLMVPLKEVGSTW
jgi:GTP-binding protein